jgi:hypothetical protein
MRFADSDAATSSRGIPGGPANARRTKMVIGGRIPPLLEAPRFSFAQHRAKSLNALAFQHAQRLPPHLPPRPPLSSVQKSKIVIHQSISLFSDH